MKSWNLARIKLKLELQLELELEEESKKYFFFIEDHIKYKDMYIYNSLIIILLTGHIQTCVGRHKYGQACLSTHVYFYIAIVK